MQLKHFEHLANLERSIVKEQFQKAVKAPVLPFGPKIGEQKKLEGKQQPKERNAAYVETQLTRPFEFLRKRQFKLSAKLA